MMIISLLFLVVLQMVPNIGRFICTKLLSQRGSLTEGNYLSDVLKYEAPNNYSREVVTVELLQDLELGSVVGKKTLAACPTTGTAVSPITGGGTCTGVTAGAKAKLGTYLLECTHAVAGQGIFSVEDPDGYGLPDAVVGQAYVNDQINFILNDGSPDFAVGDVFSITIAEGTGEVVAIDFAAVDGSQDAYGITIAAYDATTAAVDGVAIVREAKVVEANLVWRTSPAPSAAQKAAAMAQLLAKGIVSVTEV
jgi:hypothetical protein